MSSGHVFARLYDQKLKDKFKHIDFNTLRVSKTNRQMLAQPNFFLWNQLSFNISRVLHFRPVFVHFAQPLQQCPLDSQQITNMNYFLPAKVYLCPPKTGFDLNKICVMHGALSMWKGGLW